MDQEFTFKFNQSDVQIIMAGLQELPLKISAMLFNKIQEQAANQQQANTK